MVGLHEPVETIGDHPFVDFAEGVGERNWSVGAQLIRILPWLVDGDDDGVFPVGWNGALLPYPVYEIENDALRGSW